MPAGNAYISVDALGTNAAWLYAPSLTTVCCTENCRMTMMPSAGAEVGQLQHDAKRLTEYGNGLGTFRRLRIRFERRADIHEAFLKPGCALG
ncbi:TPA: hypothetical protein ACK3Q6_001345 [Burkholderia cepacia]|nr:hypothetical protein [Burkholderia cepacia]MCA8356831.1 hypothetical protein [Burkholderia cepacia]HDR9763632.1 hypothetical protein [Burkholderia cepacia ATCC 25416]HDV6364252.1 hypothetical protein [Burkholderia cepacia]